jgi:hypothetical protein
LPKKPKSKAPKKIAILSDIRAQLNAIREQVAYVVVMLDDRPNPSKGEPHPVVAKALKIIEELEKQ